MKSPGAWVRSRYLLAVAAGLMLACAFPKIGLAGFAWLAPGLIIACSLGRSGAETFRIGYVAGLAYYLTSLYWILLIPYRWHGIPLGPAAGWLSLSAYVALYPAAWVWLLTSVSPLKMRTARGFQDSTWLRRTGWALLGASLWVALEMLLARLFTGFPWNLLGASQYRMVPLIQIASFTGIYGVSFLVVWLSLSLLCAGVMILKRPTARAWPAELLLPLIVVVGLFQLGFRALLGTEERTRTIRVTCVQPSIPQTLIWDASSDEQRFRDLIMLSEQALSNRCDLLLWPEAAVPKLLRYDQDTFDAVTGLARRHHVWMIIGADDMEVFPGMDDKPRREFYNASFLVNPEGKLVGEYRKRSLVIFGEYIPRLLPFLRWFTPVEGGFTPGERAVPFEMSRPQAVTSVLICFEDIFPQLGRVTVADDTDFLVNITNNGWFGESAAQWQHAVSGLFRAVENGLPLLRCANNGLTCWVDEHGRLREIFRDARGTIYGPGFMTADVPLLHGPQTTKTFYRQHGDIFGLACVAVSAVQIGWGIILWGRVRKRTPRAFAS